MGHYLLQTTLARAWWGPLKRVVRGVLFRIFEPEGPILLGPLRGAEFHGSLAQRLGVYEVGVQRTLMSALRPEDTVFDIGAHLGFFTLFCSRLVGPKGSVVACEPNPRVTNRLLSTVQNNGCASVSVLGVAVGEEVGTLRLVAPESSHSPQAHISDDASCEGVSVPSTTLDELGRRFGLPRLVKIDVEGYAVSVLRGGAAIRNADDPPVFLLEIHNEAEDVGCRSLLIGWTINEVSEVDHRRGRYPRHFVASCPYTK